MEYENIRLPRDIYKKVQRLLQNSNRSVDDLVTEWMSDKLAGENGISNSQEQIIHQGFNWFVQNKVELEKQYGGKFVAIFNDEVVAAGASRFETLHLAWEKLGPTPCFIELVSEHPVRKIRMPHIRTTPA